MKRTFTLFLLAIILVLAIDSVGIPASPALAVSPFAYISLPTSGELTGIWGTAANNVYVVGGSGGWPLIYHYDGSNWSSLAPSLPTGWVSGQLQAIWGSGANDIYAVGYGTSNKDTVPLAFHYNGSGWTQVSLSLPGGFVFGYLYGIWGSDSDNIFAVGVGYNGANTPLIYYYNGSSWSGSGISLPSGWTEGQLRSVWGFSASDIHAVGYGKNGGVTVPLSYHYNGGGWTSTSPSRPAGWTSGSLMGVWGSGANDLYAVGSGNNGSTTAPLIYQNNGNGWTLASPSLPGEWRSVLLSAIWGQSANDIYAVGSGSFAGQIVPLILHNTGSGWNPVSVSLPNGWNNGYLYGVWGSDADDIYTVGKGSGGMLLYHTQEAPIVNLSATSHHFEDQAVGTSSLGFTVTITNTGSPNLVLGLLTANAEYNLDHDLCSGQTVAAGNTCTFNIVFSPTSASYPTHLEGAVTIPSNSPSSPDSITLRGCSITRIPTFTQIPLSLPEGWTSGVLYDVWGANASDIYAVGSGMDIDGRKPLIYHNDGNGWAVDTPFLGEDFIGEYFNAVWGSSSSDVYAVGRMTIYHKDGSGWSSTTLVPPEALNNAFLEDIWGSGPNDIYVVGWDGWPVDLWSSDYLMLYPPADIRILIYHYDGSSWTNIRDALPAGSEHLGALHGIWGTGAGNVYAVGECPLFSSCIFHYDGSTWTLAMKDTGGSTRGINYRLNDLWGSGTSDYFAIGYYLNSHYDPAPFFGIRNYYNGSSWAPRLIFGRLGDAESGELLFKIWGSGASDIYTVGCGLYHSGCMSSFLRHYDGNEWYPLVLPSPAGWWQTHLLGVWGSSSSDVYLVGSGLINDFLPLIYHTESVPVVNLSAASHDFGDQPVGTTSAAFTITLLNGGNVALNVGTLGVTGEFTLNDNECSGQVITPGNHCTFGVIFSPLSPGAKSGSVSIPSNASTSPDSVSLNGNDAVHPTVTTITGDSPDPSHAMESVLVTVTVTDGLTTPTGSVDITGGDSNCSLTLLGGTGSCSVTFNSTGVKMLTATYSGDATHAGSVDMETHEVSIGNSPPTDITLSSSSVAENQPVGTTVGALTTTDPDPADTHTYSLACAVHGADDTSFQVSGGNLQTYVPLDYETKNSYAICIRTDDGNGGTFDKNFDITVTDVNEPPTDISLSNSSVAENQQVGTTVGALTTTDSNPADTHTYSLACAVHGADDTSFQVSGSNLQTKAVFDYETKNVYSICIRTDDGNGATFDKNFGITVTDVNEPPTDISLSNSSVAENQPVGTLVGTLSISDPDSGDMHTLTLTCASPRFDDMYFLILGNRLETNSVFDYESQSSYTICIRTRDSQGVAFDKDFTINVTDVNEPPTDISLSNSSVAEGQPVATLVGTLSASDPDSGDTHTFSLACATPRFDDLNFAILGNRLETNSVFDYESLSSYTICIRALDSHGVAFDKDFTITVTDVVDITATLRSTGAQDGWILESGENTNAGGTLNSSDTAFRLGDDAARKQYRSLLSFATGAALPDNAVITNVVLKVKRLGVIGGANPVTTFRGFMLDLKKGTFGTSALQLTDWQTVVGSKTIGPFFPVLVGGWYSFDLTSAKACINKLATGGGLTQIRLRFKLDDNNNTIANYLSLYSGNAPLASRPALVVEYYVP